MKLLLFPATIEATMVPWSWAVMLVACVIDLPENTSCEGRNPTSEMATT